MPPILGVGVSRVLGAGGLGVACRGLDKVFQPDRQRGLLRLGRHAAHLKDEIDDVGQVPVVVACRVTNR